MSCSGDGLVIGKSGITVNLGGHTIEFTGTPGDGSAGVRNPQSQNFTSVVVKNGTITGFTTGVSFRGGSGTLQGLRVSDNTGLGIASIVPVVVTGNVVFLNLDGILVNAHKATITNNSSPATRTTG